MDLKQANLLQLLNLIKIKFSTHFLSKRERVIYNCNKFTFGQGIQFIWNLIRVFLYSNMFINIYEKIYDTTKYIFFELIEKQKWKSTKKINFLLYFISKIRAT